VGLGGAFPLTVIDVAIHEIALVAGRLRAATENGFRRHRDHRRKSKRRNRCRAEHLRTEPNHATSAVRQIVCTQTNSYGRERSTEGRSNVNSQKSSHTSQSSGPHLSKARVHSDSCAAFRAQPRSFLAGRHLGGRWK